MFKMVFEGDPGFGEDDEISVVSEIRVNDIVVFEQVGPGQFQMRTLAADEVEGYEGHETAIRVHRSNLLLLG